MSLPSRPSIELSDQAWRAAILWIAAAAILLRLISLDLKPFHHDEGVNGYFLLNLVRPPHKYEYDPRNYHGPSLYYLAWASSAVLGLTTFALRFVPAVAGLLTIALLIPLRRYLGNLATLIAMLLLAVSPGAVYHSRYFIHEAILVCATLGVVVGVLDYLRGNTARGLLVAAFSEAMMTTTKETWFINLGVLVCAAFGTVVWFRIPPRRIAPFFKPPVNVLAAAVLLFLGINWLLFSSFFTNPDGPVDFFRAYNFWSDTGTAAHRRAWYGYFQWLVRIELPLLVGGLAGAALAAWRRDNPFAFFAGLWAVGIIAAYSLIPYKTPWLILNFLPPLALSFGYLVSWLASLTGSLTRRAVLVASTVAVLAMTYQSLNLNFWHYDDDRWPYIYAHTSRETLTLVDTVGTLISRTPKRVPVVVMAPHQYQFPLPWYFRDVAAGYPGKVEKLEEGVAIVTEEQEQEAKQVLGDGFVRVGTYHLRTGTKLVVFASASLAQPKS